MATTSWPAATSLGTNCAPSAPEAPATKTFMPTPDSSRSTYRDEMAPPPVTRPQGLTMAADDRVIAVNQRRTRRDQRQSSRRDLGCDEKRGRTDSAIWRSLTRNASARDDRGDHNRWRVWVNVPLPKARTLAGATANTSAVPASCLNEPARTSKCQRPSHLPRHASASLCSIALSVTCTASLDDHVEPAVPLVAAGGQDHLRVGA